MTITEGIIATLGGGFLGKALELLISRLIPSGEDESKVTLSHSEAESHLRQALINRLDVLEKKVESLEKAKDELEEQNKQLIADHQDCTRISTQMRADLTALTKKLEKHENGNV